MSAAMQRHVSYACVCVFLIEPHWRRSFSWHEEGRNFWWNVKKKAIFRACGWSKWRGWHNMDEIIKKTKTHLWTFCLVQTGLGLDFHRKSNDVLIWDDLLRIYTFGKTDNDLFSSKMCSLYWGRTDFKNYPSIIISLSPGKSSPDSPAMLPSSSWGILTHSQNRQDI